MDSERTYTSFAGTRHVATGSLESTLRATREYLDAHGEASVLVFDDETGRQVEFDLRGSADEVVRRALPTIKREGPGRPKLGVVPREVSLLPRHWEWLERQSGNASATIRRLVDDARKREPARERARAAREAAGNFMWSIGGDLPGFEEASRALYAADREKFSALIREWPEDVRAHLERMAEASFPVESA